MATYGGIPSGYTNYLNDFQSLLSQHTPQMSFTPMSEGEIRSKLEAALRPGVDLAIGNRQKQTLTNKANIDVDAASRGMGSSTYVTDVKDRAQDAEASDITSLEAQYGATIAQQLMQALQQERANQFAADQFNASSRANALQSAMGLAGDFYGQSLQMAKNAGGSGGGKDYGKDYWKLAQSAYDDQGNAYNALTRLNQYAKGYSDEAVSQARGVLNKALKDDANKKGATYAGGARWG